MRGLAPVAEHRFESMLAMLDLLAAGGDRPAPPEYVFVAHHRTDKPIVLRLCEDLLAHGVRTWLDVWEPDAKARTRTHSRSRRSMDWRPVTGCVRITGWITSDRWVMASAS